MYDLGCSTTIGANSKFNFCEKRDLGHEGRAGRKPASKAAGMGGHGTKHKGVKRVGGHLLVVGGGKFGQDCLLAQ